MPVVADCRDELYFKQYTSVLWHISDFLNFLLRRSYCACSFVKIS